MSKTYEELAKKLKIDSYLLSRIIILAMLLVILILPQAVTFALPLKPSVYTSAFLKVIQDLPANSKAVFIWMMSPETMQQSGKYCAPAILNTLKVYGIKFVAFSAGPDVTFRMLYDLPTWTLAKGGPGAVSAGGYGDQFVYLGFLAGGPALFEQFAGRGLGVSETDDYGNKIADMPISKLGLNSIDAFNLVILIGGPAESNNVLQYWTNNGQKTYPKFIKYAGASGLPVELQWYPWAIHGLLVDLRGTGELEALVPSIPKSAAVGSINMTSMISIWMAIIVIFANISYITKKGGKK